MAIADRAFVWETQNCTLVDDKGDGNTANNINIPLLEVFKSIDISISVETMEATAAGDPADATAQWKYPRPKSRDWSVDITGVVNGVVDTAYIPGASDSSYNFKDVLDNMADGNGLFTYNGPLDAAGNPCVIISGHVTRSSSDLNLPDEAAEQSLRLVGYGPISVTRAAS